MPGVSMTEDERDRRDLEALRLIDQGFLQAEVCRRVGMSRGTLVRLLRDVREDASRELASD